MQQELKPKYAWFDAKFIFLSVIYWYLILCKYLILDLNYIYVICYIKFWNIFHNEIYSLDV